MLPYENLQRFLPLKIKNCKTPQPARLSSYSAKAELITGAREYYKESN